MGPVLRLHRGLKMNRDEVKGLAWYLIYSKSSKTYNNKPKHPDGGLGGVPAMGSSGKMEKIRAGGSVRPLGQDVG